MPVRVHIDQAAVNRALTGPDGAVTRLVEDTCRRVLNEAKRRCPVDEGRLRASLQSSVTVEAGPRVIGRVGTDVEYGVYVHFGTGLYGPKRQLIRPVTAKAMTWIPRTKGQGAKRGGRKTKRDTTRVFARYTRGMHPNPFLVEALAAVVPWPVEIRRV